MDERSAPTPADRALLTEAEKLRMQYRNMPTAFSGMVVICTVMSIVLEPGTGATKIVVWAGAVYLWAIARFFQWRAFNRAKPGLHEMHRWRVYSVAGSGIAGLMLSVNGNLKSKQLIARMKEGARPYPQTSDSTNPVPVACQNPATAGVRVAREVGAWTAPRDAGSAPRGGLPAA